MFYSGKAGGEADQPGRGPEGRDQPAARRSSGSLRGRITDISPNGMSFVADDGAPVLLKGTPLESLAILDGDHRSLGRDRRGPPRHPGRGGRRTLG
ncbi:MAG: hypothetical protein MZU79_02475 [Anaerotruncus sp.]|nr:hypothetical protein [Anaerotruncus sp.]